MLTVKCQRLMETGDKCSSTCNHACVTLMKPMLSHSIDKNELQKEINDQPPSQLKFHTKAQQQRSSSTSITYKPNLLYIEIKMTQLKTIKKH